jgi:hypothetical protein
MKNLIIIILLITSLLSSCGKDYKKAKFEVINKSNIAIDSLTIINRPSDEVNKLSVYNLDENKSQKIDIDMTNAEGDGRYTLSYKMNKIWITKHFGYYTNGSQTEELISIHVVSADSIIIENKLNNKY